MSLPSSIRESPEAPREVVAKELRAAAERFHDLVDAAIDYAIFLVDPDGLVASWNAGAERIKGYTADEVIGTHMERFFPEEDRLAGKPQRNLDIVRRDGRYEDEGWRVRKDGTRFWANAILTALRDESGKLIGFAKVTRDLTEKRAAEEELRRAEERFRLLIEGISDYAIYMLDPVGKVTTWNSGAEKLKGYRADEIIGQSFERFFPEKAIAEGAPARELEIARTTGRFAEESFRVRKDGSQFWAHVVLTPLTSHGELVGFAKITRDLTARRQAELTELQLVREQAARVEAERASREKDEFVAMVSHELRTPLTSILGWATMLRNSPDHPRAEKAIEAILRNAQAQTHLVEDLIDTSRMITGKLTLDLAPVALVSLLKELAEGLGNQAAQKQVKLTVVSANVAGYVVGDVGRLRQVFANLLSNALKFTPAGGEIVMSAEQHGSSIAVTVKDSGIGISAELLPHIFERFRQGDSSITRHAGGLGLGLAIVHHLVELHGGKVTAESAGAGTGTRITVTLPVRALSRAEANVEAIRTTPTSGLLAGIRVVVVDDDDDARDLVQALLANEAAAVMTACSASEGVDALASHQPHVLVSDIGMPGEDGYSFMTRVRKLEPLLGGDVPAIALTAYARIDDRKKALDAGFTAHIAKPVDPDRLLDLVKSVAKLSRHTA